MNLKNSILTLVVFIASLALRAQPINPETTALIKRLLPGHARYFEVEIITAPEGSDRFEIESRNNKIVLRGNNGVSVASALYYYLTEYAHCQFSQKEFNDKIKEWEWNWVNTRQAFPDVPRGDSALKARLLYDRYFELIKTAYTVQMPLKQNQNERFDN